MVNRLLHGSEYKNGTFMLAALPKAADRMALQERNRELTALLRPAALATAERQRAEQACALLFAQYHRDSLADSAMGVAATLSEKLPLWAICKACEDVFEGKVYDVDPKTKARKYLNPDHPVSGLRLFQVAEGHCKALRDEQFRIGQILTCTTALPAPVSTDRRMPVVRLPLMTEAQRDAERHYQAQRKKVQDDMARLSDKQREKTILAIYEKRGIKPYRNAHGVLVHPDLLAYLQAGDDEAELPNV